VECLAYHFGGFFIDYPSCLVFRVFDITVRRIGAEWFAGLPFRLENGAYLLARILGIPFVDDIKKRSKIAVLLIGTVTIIVYKSESAPR
jgi:hypothetical protein